MGKSTNARLAIAIFRMILGLMTFSFFMYYLVVEIKLSIFSTQVQHNVTFITTISNFVHNSGQERAISIMYLASPSPELLDKVLSHQLTTKQILPDLVNVLSQLPYDQIPETLQILGNITSFEMSVVNETVTADDIINFYSTINGYLFEIVFEAVAFDNAALMRELQTLIFLNWYLEWVGRERAVVCRAITEGLGDLVEFSQTIFSIWQTQDFIYLEMKLGSSSSELTSLYQIQSEPNYTSSIDTISSVRLNLINAIRTNKTEDVFSISLQDWFNNITYVIDCVFNMNSIIVGNANNALESMEGDTNAGLAIAVLGIFFESLASVQLIYVGVPVFLLYFSWRKASIHMEKNSKAKSIPSR